MVNENASLIKYEPSKCDECGRKIVVLSDLCAKCAAGIELNGMKQANRPGTNPLPTWPKPPAPPNPPPAPAFAQGEPKVWVKKPGKFEFEGDDVTIKNWEFRANITPTKRECVQAVLKYLSEKCLESDGLDTPAWNEDGIEIREITSGVIEVVQKSTGEPVRPHFTNFSPNTPSHLRERLSAPAEPTPAVAVNQPTSDQLLEVAKSMVPAVEKAIGIYTAAAINKQMLEALKVARGSLNSYTPEYAMVVEAIAAAKAAKGGV
ncbi:MAG: hypothetical protein CMN89_12080 [Sutterellaceae bacterium]|nr:hypothetical protein [Sutterellaceae bacterium]MBT85192.1 hypothetical protein [Sutterellaceae bacterium]